MLLEVRNLRVAFRRDGCEIVPVRDVSFTVPEHGRVALVGESGCGKSLTALSLRRLSPTDRAFVSGTVKAPERIAYVFQNPSDSLNPVMRIRDQIREALPKGMDRAAQDERIVQLLERTGLPDPQRAARAYPCELSTQKQVLELIDSLAAETGMAVLLITHNLGLVAGRMDFVNVMYAGQIVEAGPVVDVLADPRHPYTKGLLAAVPALDAPRDAPLADIPGTVPPPDRWPPGCAFAPRCAMATDACSRGQPPATAEGGRTWSCFVKGC